jgi:HTH-type transcriptional regulator/antitoxin HigA
LKWLFTELVHRGYFKEFKGNLRDAKENAEELLTGLFSIFRDIQMHPVYCRSAEGNINTHALDAWQAHAMRFAEVQDLPAYHHGKLNPDTISDLAKLSVYELGPRFAIDCIHQMGIAFVLLDHLPNTYLDGASFKTPSGRPVIGMTLRHDRLDNFWFTLIHELVHVHRHLEQENYVFFDDTDHLNHNDCAPQEKEANEMASALLIPEAAWTKAKDRLVDSQSILAFAGQMGISPAIIAGRLRWEAGDYRILSDLVGQNQVRRIFSS